MSERTNPYHCPYCGDEDLRPHGTVHGEWECRACRRVFAVSFRGLLSPPTHPVGGADTPEQGSGG
jgi:ribosomal protein L37AE/L43A